MEEVTNDYFEPKEMTHVGTIIRNIAKDAVMLIDKMETPAGKLLGEKLMDSVIGLNMLGDSDEAINDVRFLLMTGHDSGLIDDARGMRVMDLLDNLQSELKK